MAKSNLRQVLEVTTQAAANCTTSSGSWGHPSCPLGMLPQEQHLGHQGVILHSAAPGTGPLTPQPLQAPIMLPTGETHLSFNFFLVRAQRHPQYRIGSTHLAPKSRLVSGKEVGFFEMEWPGFEPRTPRASEEDALSTPLCPTWLGKK